MRLAADLDLIAPGDPSVLEEDEWTDLAVFDNLTCVQAQLEQMLGVEAEIVDAETWNYETSSALTVLAHEKGEIPFGTRAECVDLKPTASIYSAAATPSASTHSAAADISTSATPTASGKGKERADPQMPKKQSVYHMFPMDVYNDWLSASGNFFFFFLFLLAESSDGAGNPLPAMKPAAHVRKLDEVVSNIFPELLGDGSPHHCIYRQHLLNILKADLKKQMSEYLSGEWCWKLNFLFLVTFLQFTLLSYLAIGLPRPMATPTRLSPLPPPQT